MPRLVRIKPESAAFAQAGDASPAATPHVPGPRHARAVSGEPPRRTALSIRSAERRRWSADLTGPDLSGLVVHGLGGIGKSTLVAQIAARACRLQPWRVVTVVSGETSPHGLPVNPTEADLLVLDNFDDNLTGPDGSRLDSRADRQADRRADRRTVRDPALAALLANWQGKLLITCREPFALPAPGGDRLGFRHLGPLTRSGAAELALAMPALRRPQRTRTRPCLAADRRAPAHHGIRRRAARRGREPGGGGGRPRRGRPGAAHRTARGRRRGRRPGRRRSAARRAL